MNNILITNSDNTFMIRFSNFEYNADHVQFDYGLKNSIFKVFTTTYDWIEEVRRFKEELKQMSERRTKLVVFSPLGEFWTIKFQLKGDCIDVEGGISDLERIQSHFEFHNQLSIDDISSSLNRADYSSC